MATFQEENQRGAGMWMERKQRFCEILRREDGSCSRLCDQRNHVNSTAFRRPWIPFLLDSSVWRIRNACLSSDKRLKKAEDVWRRESIFHNEMPVTRINQTEGGEERRAQWEMLFAGLNPMSTSVTNFLKQVWGEQQAGLCFVGDLEPLDNLEPSAIVRCRQYPSHGCLTRKGDRAGQLPFVVLAPTQWTRTCSAVVQNKA